jgi:hypothetical protein
MGLTYYNKPIETNNGKHKMNANTLALGRNHYTADSASLTDFGDCFRANLNWADGAYVYSIFDTKAEAVAYLARMGWSK